MQYRLRILCFTPFHVLATLPNKTSSVRCLCTARHAATSYDITTFTELVTPECCECLAVNVTVTTTVQIINNPAIQALLYCEWLLVSALD